jgi:hypothetical protein
MTILRNPVPVKFMIAEIEVHHQLYSDVLNWANESGNYTIFKQCFNGGYIDFPPLSIDNPVTNIYWSDAVVWCNALTEYINSSNGFRTDMDLCLLR